VVLKHEKDECEKGEQGDEGTSFWKRGFCALGYFPWFNFSIEPKEVALRSVQPGYLTHRRRLTGAIHR
jgi:hypothetical protein